MVQTPAPNSARMAKSLRFSQGHPKPAFSEKVQREDEEKFFKDRPKNSPHLKQLTALWPKWYYPLFSMQLKCKDWRKVWRKEKLQKCPKGQVIAIFERSHKTRKGGRREIFQRSPKKQPSLKTVNSTLAEMVLSSIFYAVKVQRLEKSVAQRKAPKVPERPSYCNF